MHILVTGAAGFIGFHLSKLLMARGDTVVGLDNLNNYYDVRLKQARLSQLQEQDRFSFVQADLSEPDTIKSIFAEYGPFSHVVNLAAQAGVRYSIENPWAYMQSNMTGHMAILEACRHEKGLQRLVYASSSSVYGGLTDMPFSVDQRTDTPISLYAATKKSNELMSHSYAHLYRFEQVGLRFFTVYGPWGRPDMAMFLFTKAILEGKPIKVFNHGKMQRDFTFIDDIVAGVVAALEKPYMKNDAVPHRVYNLGNHRAEQLMEMIGIIEKEVGKDAEKIMCEMQPGDVPATYADIDASRKDLDFEPKTPISEGIPQFVEWYRSFYNV